MINNVAPSSSNPASSGPSRFMSYNLANRGLGKVSISARDVNEVLGLLNDIFIGVNFAKLIRPLNNEQYEKLDRLQELGIVSAAQREDIARQHFLLGQEPLIADADMRAGVPGETNSEGGSVDGSNPLAGARAGTTGGEMAFEVAAGDAPGAALGGRQGDPVAAPGPDQSLNLTSWYSRAGFRLGKWGPAVLGLTSAGAVAMPFVKGLVSVSTESNKPGADGAALASRVLLPVGVGATAAAVIWQRLQFEWEKRKLVARLDAGDEKLSKMEAGLRGLKEGGLSPSLPEGDRSAAQ